jgi:hypothetical protein
LTTTRPQILIYDHNNLLIDSDTAIADTDTLEVSVTPVTDHVYTIWLYGRDSAAGALTTFSSLKINGVDAVINDKGEIYPVLIGSKVINEYYSYPLPLYSHMIVNHKIESEIIVTNQFNSHPIPIILSQVVSYLQIKSRVIINHQISSQI